MKRAVRALSAGLAMLITAHGQSNPTPAPAAGGQAQFALEGYYLGGLQQPVLDTTGTSIQFQQFLPRIGILAGSLEGFGSQSRLQTGESFLELRGAPFAGRYWTIIGGDFRFPALVVESPFQNIFTPDVYARGVDVQTEHGDTKYAFFAGTERLTAGPRVAYSIAAPQVVIGASVTRRTGRHLIVGARVMQFSTSPESIRDNPYLFPAGRTVALVRTAAVQALYTPFRRLKIYGEVSRPIAGSGSALTSSLVGATWETSALSLKANYVYQGVLYFPLAGYFAGDRRGPFGEARYRPWKRLELYASASQYRNNLENNSSLPFLTSNNSSAGLSGLLPQKISINGQVSTVRFTDQAPGDAAVISRNRQISGSLSRNIGRQTLQAGWREIRTGSFSSLQRQRSSELGDTYQLKHFSVGGAVRYQQQSGIQRLNSLFFRGLAQVSAGPISAYANVEIGNDLADETVFSTQAYQTSVAGVSVRMPRSWNLQVEAFRNRLNLTLNQENIFLLQNGAGLAGISPAAANLAETSQWSLFFRLSKQFYWGAGLPSESLARTSAETVVKLTGSVDGVVHLKTLAGSSPGVGIPITLDSSRTAMTGVDGRYIFDGVPEGVHEVGLSLEQLPADFDPGDTAKSRVFVNPNRVARADFDVLPLAMISGKVTGPEGATPAGIIVRLLPSDRYTSTQKDGTFTFYNVREGDFEIAVDTKSLPEGGELEAPDKVGVVVRSGGPVNAVAFRFTVKSQQKPIRKVLDRHF